MTTQMVDRGELRNFIEEYADNYYALMLVFFFAANPNARFNSQAIFGALGIKGNQQNLKQALNNLVEKRVTDVITDNPVPVYRLGDDISTRSQVMELGKLNIHEKQELLRMTRSA